MAQDVADDLKATAAQAAQTAFSNAVQIRNAEQAMASTVPGCGLSWNLLAGIGRIESGHANGGATATAATSFEPTASTPQSPTAPSPTTTAVPPSRTPAEIGRAHV